MVHLEVVDGTGIASYIHVSFVDAAPLVHRIEVYGSHGRLTIDGNTLRGNQLPTLDDAVLVVNEQVQVPQPRGWHARSCPAFADRPLTQSAAGPGSIGTAPRKQTPVLQGPFQNGTVRFAYAMREFLLGRQDDALSDAATMADGVYVQAVIDAARRSSDRRAWEPVSPAAVEFVRQYDRAARQAALKAAAVSDDDDDGDGDDHSSTVS